jgi:hypothetical protein
MATVLRERYGDSALVLMPDSYPRTLTYDGCDACAERVLPQLRDVVAATPSLRALSLLGYSFGGLVRAQTRAAIVARVSGVSWFVGAITVAPDVSLSLRCCARADCALPGGRAAGGAAPVPGADAAEPGDVRVSAPGPVSAAL